MQLDKHFRTKSKFYDKVHYSKIEREVEDIYNEFLQNYFKDVQIEHPYACDGLITKDNLKLIMEYKYDYDFNSKVSQAKVITQVLFYLKRFENNGDIIPNIILIGDINECFIMHTNEIVKYLDKNLDWNIAPSGAAEKNPDLVLEISNDETLNPFVFKIDENFQFDSIIEKINDLSENIKRYVHITEHNISNIYDYFCKNVITDMKKVSANNIVSVFIGCITNDDAFYMHPSKKGILVTPHGNIRVNDRNFNAFFSHYARKYSPVEKNKFAEISDRLIEDTNRRNKGEFYTPTLFVDYAHKMISEALGPDWKSEYVVWDNCCGTKNLTRDYRFKELYCSTLEEAELEIGKKYNPEAISFQYDFLNDDLEKLPKELLNAFEQNKPLVFLLNPPYSYNGGQCGSAKGASNTKVKELMVKNNIDGKGELYIQFLYKISLIKQKFNLTNCYIALFCKQFICRSSFKNFRKDFLNQFCFINGIMFCAGEFDNVSNNYGLTFNIWKSEKDINNNYFAHKVVENINGEIKILEENKLLYNTDNNKSFIDILSNNIKRINEFPNFRYKLLASDDNIKVPNNYIGCIYNAVNRTMLATMPYAGNNGAKFMVTTDNYKDIISYYALTYLTHNSWKDGQNEFLIPNKNYLYYDNFINNALIFCIFNGDYDWSLRNINYHDKLWDIKNEFFWMSKSEIETLANEYNNDDCYNDAHTSPERFVYKKLQEIELTQEAQAVLDKACDIVRKTFKYRELFNEEHPEVQINNWDCGFYQIKMLCKEYMPDLLKEFKEVYKVLADKMRPMVYELGFLK